MELENLSIENQRKQYGATSQSKPLQKMPFHPVGAGVDITLNRFIMLERKRVDGMCIQVKRELPEEIWQKIWDYLDQKGKFNLGSLSHSFEYIRQCVQLDVCHKKLLRACSPDLIKDHNGYYSNDYNVYEVERSALHRFYISTKKIGDICQDTKTDTVKARCKELLEDSKGEAYMLIAETESRIKGQRHYTRTEEYKKLKYLKEVFSKPDTCIVWWTECKDEWGACLTCYYCKAFCANCCFPCIILLWSCTPED